MNQHVHAIRAHDYVHLRLKHLSVPVLHQVLLVLDQFQVFNSLVLLSRNVLDDVLLVLSPELDSHIYLLLEDDVQVVMNEHGKQHPSELILEWLH